MAWQGTTEDVKDLEDQLAEAHQHLQESKRTSEHRFTRAKEDTREKMLCAHERELESQDYLIQLLKEKVGCLQQQLQRNPL